MEKIDLKRSPGVLKFMLKTWWIALLLFILPGIIRFITNLSLSLMDFVLVRGVFIVFAKDVVGTVIPAALSAILYTFVYCHVNKRIYQSDSDFGSFLGRNWFRFFVILICYSVLDFYMKRGLMLIHISVLSSAFFFFLLFAQYYAFAFSDWSKDNRKTRFTQARNGLKHFLIMALFVIIVSQPVIQILSYFESKLMIWPDIKEINFLSVMLDGPQATIASSILRLIGSILEVLVRYFAIVYICMFIARSEAQGDLNSSKQKRKERAQGKRYKRLLEQFRDLYITKDQLYESLPDDQQINLEQPITVSMEHVIDVLVEYKNEMMKEDTVFEWVETITSRDWFEYNKEQHNQIATVVNELHEMHEGGKGLTLEKAAAFIHTLRQNADVSDRQSETI